MKDTKQFKAGDLVEVLPHVVYQHLVGNVIVKPARQRWHPGYKEVRVIDVFDGIAEVEVTADGDVDYVPLTDLKLCV